MVIKNLCEERKGWHRFNLNVGGFTIKNWRWHRPTRRIKFPIRYDRSSPPRRHEVIHAYGAQVMRLRALLESGQTRAPRDRRPCHFRIHRFRYDRYENRNLQRWLIFDFTVRGFTILGCRWLPDTGSIQLPVSFTYRPGGYSKRQIVCAFGAHINRLRKALEAALPKAEQAEPVGVDAHDAWLRRNPEPHLRELNSTRAPIDRSETGGDLVQVTDAKPVEV